MPHADPRLAIWESYYVIVGSSGAALIGLQFVVITLIAGMRRRALAEGVNAFSTPVVVHFAVTLVVSALMSAPWPSLGPVSAALTACGLGGLSYSLIVVRRARRQRDYAPVWQDWLWFNILPSLGYVVIATGGLLMHAATAAAEFLIAAGALGLLLVGIHNAWDTVTHLVVTMRDGDAPRAE